jgi:uncharacterized protein (DUF58 family)
MAALGALVPLVLLYLLKQKRVEEKVPANFLWKQAIEDLRASSLFQRFRAPLLFLLQAASIVLCALAAAGASLDLDVGRAPRRVILLLDRSASMRTADEGGRTRFDAARDLAEELVDGLARGDEMTVVAFDSRAEVVAAFTPDAERLRETLAALAPRDLPTRLGDGLETAVSFARASRGFDPEIVVVSDGGVEEVLPSVPFPLRYVKVGKSGANQGISSVAVSRTPGESAQALVRVDNGDEREARRTVVLRKGDEILDAKQVDLEPGGDAAVFFSLPDADETQATRLSVALEGTDVLAADDRVAFLLRPATPRTGLVVRSAPSLHLDPARLGKLRPNLVVIAATPEEAAASIRAGEPKIDLVIWDGVAPTELPDVPAQVYVDCVPPGAGLVETGTLPDPIVIDWSRTHATTARCQFDDVFVLEARKLAGTERSLALVESTGGPLVLLTPVPGREVVVVAFDPAKSNLPLKLAWPLFLANTIDYLLAAGDRAGDEAVVRTGTQIPLDPRRAPWTGDAPDGTKLDVSPDAQGRPVLRDTTRSGVHVLRDATGRESLHALALLDPAEVRVAPRDTLVVGGEARASDPSGLRRNLLLRDPLLLALLGVLLLEWAVWCGRR